MARTGLTMSNAITVSNRLQLFNPPVGAWVAAHGGEQLSIRAT
jgi:hypothetical protein